MTQSLAEQLKPIEKQLPRLQEVTTEYLDNIARQLQFETFSEQAKQSYDEAWRQHYAQLETAAIMFHGDGNDLTLCCKLIDSRIRNLEYELEQIASYGQRVADEINDHVITDPEITSLQYDKLIERRDRLRDQYAYVKNMHYVLLTSVRPEIERRTGYTMNAYKSKATLDAEKKAKQYRPKRQSITMDKWQQMSDAEKRQALQRNHYAVG